MHVILIAAQKGGAGKSTLAVHLSALADRDGKTLLVDTDPQGSLSMWHGRRTAETPCLTRASAQAVPEVLSTARREGVAWAVIDSPPHNTSLISTLMSRATLTLIPVRPGPFDLDAVGATLAMARSLKAPMACIINAAPPTTRGERQTSAVAETRAVLASMGAPVLPGQVSQRASLSHALITGQSVDEYDPHGRATAEIAAMWSTVSELARSLPRHA
ncbi:ParA family protein [Methylobacterium nodulans]|uniref:Cobyrinic acid ac-diamide synthase n=1 Tax=Methylobacterium nodulans (strain LMG 21967 / CNCM I-2342 / ORS 2060) TaxID=460265 RepID=B8IMI6_METNO|nr:ParA family protein [Methylobacterium nodulans]ACL58372.1 cobyrinic acid ac-diamide synthase [Methylobacterium nodulans ORS 2060]